MLEIKGVKKSYGEFQLDCSLNVEKGRITGLVGENGAGKSTLFKAVLGLISYDAGEIKILGKTQEELSEKEKEELGVNFFLALLCISCVFQPATLHSFSMNCDSPMHPHCFRLSCSLSSQ